MKIEYRTPAGAGSYTVLADEGDATGPGLGARITGYQPSLKKGAPQADDLAFSDTAFVRDTGNQRWALRFGVERQHADAAAALAYLATHLLVFGPRGNFDLKITVGATALVLGNAAVIEITPRPHSDLSTFISYDFLGTSYA